MRRSLLWPTTLIEYQDTNMFKVNHLAQILILVMIKICKWKMMMKRTKLHTHTGWMDSVVTTLISETPPIDLRKKKMTDLWTPFMNNTLSKVKLMASQTVTTGLIISMLELSQEKLLWLISASLAELLMVISIGNSNHSGRNMTSLKTAKSILIECQCSSDKSAVVPRDALAFNEHLGES